MKNQHRRRPRTFVNTESDAALAEVLGLLKFGDTPGSRKWLTNVAVQEFCLAIVRHGPGIPFPIACDIRMETPEEKAARVLCAEQSRK